MPDFSKNLFDFYKFVSPADNLGKFTIDSRIGGGKDKERKPIPQLASDRIKETIIENFIPGGDLIKIKGTYSNNRNVDQEQYLQAVRGNYNVVFQRCESPSAEFLYTGYFADYPKPSPSKKPPPPNDEAVAPEPPPKNFWGDVCGEGPGGGPPIDFSMIFLRAPMLSRTVSNTDLIQLYLTTMPNIFANQLMPYCDVEFQLPILNRPDGEPDRINRPSLYRFLMGSGQDISSLTEADKSIANVLSVNTKKKNFPDPSKSQTFFGMEMFTSPQTLVNMNALSANSQDARGARLNDAKPFLPPATLKDVGITIQNAGARTFGRRTANVKLHVHDRKRLVEMAEFLRGSDGYAKSTVWITYGMLAPRGRGENDVYAKFINENMLVREAFVISNTQFSFTQDGGCEVTLTLSGKGGRRGLTTAITFGEIDALKRSIDETIARIKANIASFGGERSEKLGFSQKEIRMAQFISSAAEGNIPTSEEDVKKINDEIDTVKQQLATGLNRGPDFNKETAISLLEDLKKVVNNRTTGLKKTAKTFVEDKINGLNESKDPFFPDKRKNDPNNHMAVTTIDTLKNFITDAVREGGLKYYDEKLCDVVSPRDNYVSLGRVFSSLCAPAMLYALSDEFSWNKSLLTKEQSSCPYEVQFIFYQLNNRCGPVSSHNIAEFPMNKALFVDGFLKFIEATAGGDAITLEQMIEFINEQLQDPRQPGYGRSSFYKPFDPAAKEQKLEPKEQEAKFTKSIQEWSKKYGDFITPDLTFEIEVGSYAGNNSTGTTSRDLLADLAGKVAAGYTDPVVKTRKGEKTIIKIHIFDRTCSPLDKITKSLRLASDGTYYLVSSEYANNENVLKLLENKKFETSQGVTKSGKEIVMNGETVAVDIGQGKEALMEYLGQMVPRLVIGAEGSLISQVNLQSKTSGLEGTIALQGGVQKRESSLASTGLSQQQFNLPMILYPAQLTMNSIGCPLAAMGQHFFIDFGTNTTLDNNYVVTQVSHAFSPGKFETTWQLCYYDGYGRMISNNDIESQLKSIGESLKQAETK